MERSQLVTPDSFVQGATLERTLTLSKKKSRKFHPKHKKHARGPKPPPPRFGRPPRPGPHAKIAAGTRECVGIVHASDRGFGFLIPEDGSPDAFLPPREMRNLMNGDTIRARVLPDREPGRFSAQVVSIVNRRNTTLVGVLSRESGHWLLKPSDPRIPHWVRLLPGKVEGKVGDVAVARVTRWPSAGASLEGRLEEVLGDPGKPGVDMRIVIRKHHWPEAFSPEAERQATSLPGNPGEHDTKGRLDLRRLPTLTIDGRDARDFDDAISLERIHQGSWRLGVHIADVSHYVQPGTALDSDARDRATSLYLPDRVLPMLPHALSDGLCSLREGVPRLTMSAFLEYNPEGVLVKTHFAPSVILSRRRGIYEEVQQILDGKADLEVRRKYDDLEPMLRDMARLSAMIRRGRERAGALDFDLPEVRAVLDESGRAIDIRRVDRLGTHKLIEDFMVSANEAVADFLWKRKIPSLYRVHEPPKPQDSLELSTLLKAYGIPFREGDLATPKGLQDLLRRIQGHPLEPTISTLTLRSLTMAVYGIRNAGHFGLALKSYCHFTSPIRRYPDLVTHRALKKALGAGIQPGGKTEDLGLLGKHTSFQERAAEKAEREGQKVKQLSFMETKIGETAAGRITHVTSHGAFVEMEPWGVEGFVSLENFIGGPYQFDEAHLRLSGRKDSIRLGDSLKVRIESVDHILQRLTLKQTT